MKKNKSFTLIEMLVVIFIMIILIGIVVVVFQRGNYEAKQNDSQRKKDMAELSSAIEAFKADKGHYPLINWGNGVHVASLLYSDTIDDCGAFSTTYGTQGDNYMPAYVADPDQFDPGTTIVYDSSNRACDDLSLQLLGKAYLPKMPPMTDTSQDLWVIPGRAGASNLKPYLDEIPQDPLIKPANATGDEKYYFVCYSGCTLGHQPTSDYDPTLSYAQNYRYYYNSYYDCNPEGINVGDRYWMNTIVQLIENGDHDVGLNIYFYELGNANFWRLPRSTCAT